MKKRNLLAVVVLLLATVAFTAQAQAKPSEFDLISKHLKTHYGAKKAGIPFLFVAKAAVWMVRPAGVKSFGVTLFKDLKFSMETVDKEMQAAMRNSFGPEWTSVFRVRSKEGQQAYMYMKEDGKNIKVAVVTIDKDQAAMIRATFSPDKLAAFINDPKIFGISLKDDDDQKQKALKAPDAVKDNGN